MEAATPPQPPPPPAPEPPAPSGAADYPARFDATRQAEYHRALPFFKWLLAFPHYLVLILLVIGAVFVHLIAFFAVIFTRRYPRGLWDYMTGVLRWATRVGSYVYLMTDRYPPFSLQDDPEYPTRLRIDYPEAGVDRWRPLVHWLLIIPYAFVSNILHQLAGLVAFIGAFVILFTKELPEGMFKLILVPFRWQVRTNVYAGFLVTRYPPFEWDDD
jgi:hypothetical protein